MPVLFPHGALELQGEEHLRFLLLHGVERLFHPA